MLELGASRAIPSPRVAHAQPIKKEEEEEGEEKGGGGGGGGVWVVASMVGELKILFLLQILYSKAVEV